MATTKKLLQAAAGVSTGSGSGSGGGGASGWTATISDASYDSVSFSVNSQDNTPFSMAFNADGTKMFVLGNANDTIYQYTLSTAFDLSTSSYSSVSFSVSSQESAPTGLAFNTDGTKMYVLGHTNKTVYQYTLTTGFDLSSASYANVSFSVSSQDTYPSGLVFNTDGTKMYICGFSGGIHEYTLSNAFTVSSASYNNVQFSVTNQASQPYGFRLNPAGTKVYVVMNSDDKVYQYSLSTAFDLSSISYDSVSFSVGNEDNAALDIAFSNDGTKMYLVGNTGNAIYQYSTGVTVSSGGGSSSSAIDVENVFAISTYTSSGAATSIVNNLDMATDGGLVWLKSRTADQLNQFYDTERGVTKALDTGTTGDTNRLTPDINSEATNSTGLTAFNSNGFSIGNHATINTSGEDYVAWSFLKHESFFDVQTWTGDGTNSRSLPHDLDHAVGCIMVKCTSHSTAIDQWWVWHKDLTSNQNNLTLSTSHNEASNNAFHATAPTTTHFYVSSASQTLAAPPMNGNGKTYVAYLFADNDGDGIFGTTADQDIISCGTFTGDGTARQIINVGFEAQFVMTKQITTAAFYDHWKMHDTTRGMTVDLPAQTLYPTGSSPESTFASSNWMQVHSSGFATGGGQGYENVNGAKYIYIAIRRPSSLVVPTDASKVFEALAYTGNDTANVKRGDLLVDMNIIIDRTNTSSLAGYHSVWDRMRGSDVGWKTNVPYAESPDWEPDYYNLDHSHGFSNGTNLTYINKNNSSYISYMFKRAKGFFDVAAYKGSGAGTTFSHALGVTPEFAIFKNRKRAVNTFVYGPNLGTNGFLKLNLDAASVITGNWFAATTSQVTIGVDSLNAGTSGDDYVCYLFASLAGVSKISHYTGNGSSQTIDAGFSAGARFILIKRTDSTGNWYVWDAERGVNASSDPYILLNDAAAEVTTSDHVDPANSGFIVNGATVNASGGQYMYLAIA